MGIISYKDPNEKRALAALIGMDKLSSVVRPLKLVYKKTQQRFQSLFAPRYMGPDFQRIVDTAQVDSLPAISFRRHTEQIMNAGWAVTSRNPKAARYIQDRLYEIGQRMGMPFEAVLTQIIYDVVRFSNALVYLNRNTLLSPGSKLKYANANAELPPIVGLEVMPVQDVMPQLSERSNRVEKWRFGGSTYMGKSLTVPSANILHIPFLLEPGNVFGTPWIMPVLDDIQDLRAVEAVINSIIQQQGTPLYHVKITDPVIDRETDMTEIQRTRLEIENGALEGGIYVSDSRHEILPISYELDISAYQFALTHYKNRAKEGANLSDIDLGQGGTANRNTAGTLTEKGVAFCTFIARSIEPWLNMFLLDPLLMEGGYDWDFSNDDNRATLEFQEIDIDRKIRTEVHNMMLFQGNAITHDELRLRMGEEVLPESAHKGLQFKMIGEAQEEAKQQIAAKNQHGTSIAPKTKKDSAHGAELLSEAWEHYTDGLKVSGRSGQLGKEGLERELRIADRLERNAAQAGSDSHALEVGRTCVGNLVRTQAFLLGATGNLSEIHS